MLLWEKTMAKWSKDTVYHQVLRHVSCLLSLCIVIRRRRLIYFLCFNPRDICLADLGEERHLTTLQIKFTLVGFIYDFFVCFFLSKQVGKITTIKLNIELMSTKPLGLQSNWHLKMLWAYLMIQCDKAD